MTPGCMKKNAFGPQKRRIYTKLQSMGLDLVGVHRDSKTMEFDPELMQVLAVYNTNALENYWSRDNHQRFWIKKIICICAYKRL